MKPTETLKNHFVLELLSTEVICLGEDITCFIEVLTCNVIKGSLQRLFSPEMIKIRALGKSLPECYINHIVASLMFPLVRDTHILFAKS